MVRDLDMDKALKGANVPRGSREAVEAAVASGQIPFQKLPSYKRGGVVRKTGLARLHKGERVLSARVARILGGAGKARKRKRMVKRRA